MDKKKFEEYLAKRGKASVAEVQRELSLPYSEARALFSALEKDGRVSLDGVTFVWIAPGKPQGGQEYDIDELRRELRELVNGKTDDGTPLLYIKALEYALQQEAASIEQFKKRFPIADSTARLILDWCVKNGYVANGVPVITRKKFDATFGKYISPRPPNVKQKKDIPKKKFLQNLSQQELDKLALYGFSEEKLSEVYDSLTRVDDVLRIAIKYNPLLNKEKLQSGLDGLYSVASKADLTLFTAFYGALLKVRHMTDEIFIKFRDNILKG